MFRPEKNFLSRDPPLVKGKIFDTRFGLIHVQTRKKIFVKGPPPPPVKGKNFDTRFGLIHVQTGGKFFCWGTPPLPSKGKIFWHQIWLDTCSDWEKDFLSRDPPPRMARNCYGHAVGGMPLTFMQEDFLVFSVCSHFGEGGCSRSWSQIWKGWSQVSDFWGVPSLRFSGGVQGLRFSGEGGTRSQ